jgi:hypothetical protein
MDKRVSSVPSIAILVAGLCAAGAATLFAQNPKFEAARERLRHEAAKNRAAQGIEVTAALLASNPFAHTAVKIQKVAPGGSVALTIPAKYPAGTTILSERDGAVLSGATMSATSYSARMTIGPDETPGFARLLAFTPITFDNGQRMLAVAFIDAAYRFELKSANGIMVRVTPAEKTFTIDDQNKNARIKYQADFFQSGETKPFETLIGLQAFGIGDDARSRIDIALVETARSTDPAVAQRKVDDFGCRLLQVYPGKAGAAEGTVLCGKNFNGGVLRTTGTMTLVR